MSVNDGLLSINSPDLAFKARFLIEVILVDDLRWKLSKTKTLVWKKQASSIYVKARRALGGSVLFTKELIMQKHMPRTTWFGNLIHYLSIMTKVWTQRATKRPFKTIMYFKWGDINSSRSVTPFVVHLCPRPFHLPACRKRSIVETVLGSPRCCLSWKAHCVTPN